MRILIAHSRYMSGPVSGENRVVEDEIRLLREGGHDVTSWTPEPVPPQQQSAVELLKTSADAIWSRSASRHLKELIRQHRPEVVHLHNLLPALSSSVIRAAHAESVPVVYALHNYRLMCLPATLEREGAVCERCVGHLPLQGVRFGCYRDSKPGSAVVATSLGLHRAIGTFSKIALYLPVSQFVQDKYAEAGFEEARMRVKPNFAWGAQEREGPGDYFLYAGRLSREKGVHVLVDAWRPSLGTLLVVGAGAERSALLGRARALDGVTFKDPVSPGELEGLIRGARAVIVPSIWFETSGRIIMEAYAAGVPVIASRMGALPEAVEDERSGLLVAPGDAPALADAMAQLTDDARSVQMGAEARARWRQRYTPEEALANLEASYDIVR